MYPQIILDKPSCEVFNVLTLNKEPQMLKITFRSFSKVLNKEFFNVELHRSLEDAKFRACALNWQVWKVEAA